MKRLFALLLTLCMLLTLLPMGTLAENACLEGCTEEAHAEGCPNAPKEEKTCQQGCLLADTEHEQCRFACAKNAACTLYDGHDGDCAYACLEGCAEGSHAEGCPNAPAPQNPPAPVAEEEAALYLFAKNTLGNYLSSAMFIDSTPQVFEFYLAQSAEDESRVQVEFSNLDAFTKSGDNVTMTYANPNAMSVSMTGAAGESYLTYTAGEDVYTFKLIWNGGNAGGNGGGQGGGEGGGSPKETTTCTKTTGCMQADGHDGDCVVSQLVARIVDGGYFEDLLVSQQDGWAVYFFLKTGETYTYIEDEENLTATGKATLDRYEMWDKEGKLGYLVGGSGLGTGAITYKGLELDVTCGLYRENGPAILAKNASGNYLEMGHFFTQNPQNLQFYLADSPLDEELTQIEFTDTSKFTTSGDNITLEYVEANTLKVTMTGNADQNYIKYKHNETTEYTFRVWWLGESAGGNGGGNEGESQNNSTVVLDYQNGNKTVPVTVGFSYEYAKIRLTEGGTRVSYDPNNEETAGDLNMPVYLGALVNFGEHEEQAAPKEFYEKISNVKFSLENIVNMDPYGNETPNASLEEENTLMEIGTLDYKTIGNAVLAKANALFNADLVATFTYEGEDHEIRIPFTYDSQMVMLIADDLDTAAKLNAVLASSDDLLEWFESKNKAMYDNYMASNRSSFIDIYLPAVEYTDIIVANPVPDTNEFVHNSVRLYGHENGTTMPGLHIKGNVWVVWGINFEADGNKKMTVGNEQVTCGVLAENANMRGGNFVGSVNSCSFTGFDYGIRSTQTGYVGGAWNCGFVNCKNGVYIDCGKGENIVSGDHGEIGNSTFIDNADVKTVAITIRNLPKGMTPYKMNVQYNRFLGCHKDFKITTPGNPHYFYFYNNYYGSAVQTFSTRSAESRSAQIELGETDDTKKAVVITNPRLVSIDDDKTLGVDSSLESVILNDRAGSLLISGMEDITAKTEIGVVVSNSDGQGVTEIGRWTFNGGE